MLNRLFLHSFVFLSIFLSITIFSFCNRWIYFRSNSFKIFVHFFEHRKHQIKFQCVNHKNIQKKIHQMFIVLFSYPFDFNTRIYQQNWTNSFKLLYKTLHAFIESEHCIHKYKMLMYKAYVYYYYIKLDHWWCDQ